MDAPTPNDTSRAHRALGVLVSGRGSNLQAILDAIQSGELDADLRVVVSNNPDAYGLERARARGVPTVVVDHREFRGKGRRRRFEMALDDALRSHGVHYIVLAGFMRILSPWFVRRHPLRIVNIHPALLPSFPGLHVQQKALDHGVKVSGVTVHFVDESVDGGPIIGQTAVPVRDDDDDDRLSARILVQEHLLYPRCLRWLVEGQLTVDGRVVRRKDPAR